jgi:hypothetical protein
MAYKPRTLDEIRGALALELATQVVKNTYSILGEHYTVRNDRVAQERIRDLLDMFTLLQHEALGRSDVEAVVAFREAAGECRDLVDLDQVVATEQRRQDQGY